MIINNQIRWYSAVQGSPPLPCRRRTVLTVCQRLSVWVMVGSDTIVVIPYMTMKVMLAPKYKAPGNIYQALCRQKTIKHRFLVLPILPGKMATHSYWILHRCFEKYLLVFRNYRGAVATNKIQSPTFFSVVYPPFHSVDEYQADEYMKCDNLLTLPI